MVEAHFGVPMAGAVLNAINTRLDAGTIAFILGHGEAKVLLTDTEFAPVVEDALAMLGTRPLVIDIEDPEGPGGRRLGRMTYEEFLATGDDGFEPLAPEDEWQAIALNYTSGTTGDPKGVVYHHRGAYLNALGNSVSWSMGQFPVYLWTLPMFHCNGWCFPWTVTALAGTHVCLRRVEAPAIFDALSRHRRHASVRRAHRHVDAGEHSPRGAPGLAAGGPDDDGGCRPARRRDRGDGGHGRGHHPCLRPDRDLRTLHGLGLAARMGRPAHCREGGAEGAAGRDLRGAGGGDGGRPRNDGAGAGRWRDDGRDLLPRQHHDEGVSQEPLTTTEAASRAAGSTPAISP
jgi:hypothetical protein